MVNRQIVQNNGLAYLYSFPHLFQSSDIGIVVVMATAATGFAVRWYFRSSGNRNGNVPAVPIAAPVAPVAVARYGETSNA